MSVLAHGFCRATCDPTSACGLARLTDRERQVLALVAEGASNQAVSTRLYLSIGAVEKHVASIFTKLHLPPDAEVNRRVAAVLRFVCTSNAHQPQV